MNIDKEERQRQQALRRLGSDDPRCANCREANWRILELHHIAGRAYDGELTVILCGNCHAKVTDPADNAAAPAAPPQLECVGHFLLGLSNLLVLLADKAKEWALQLLEAAQVCPWPHGWQGAPERVAR